MSHARSTIKQTEFLIVLTSKRRANRLLCLSLRIELCDGNLGAALFLKAGLDESMINPLLGAKRPQQTTLSVRTSVQEY